MSAVSSGSSSSSSSSSCTINDLSDRVDHVYHHVSIHCTTPPTIYQTSRRVVPPDLDVASLEKFFAAKPLKIRLRQDKTSKLLGNTIVCTSKPFISSLQNVCPLFFFVTYFSSPLLLLFFAHRLSKLRSALQCCNRVASLGRFLGADDLRTWRVTCV